MEKISIIIPCYNMEKRVKRCINSIKKQSYKNFEAILVDDGSKDGTKDVIKKNITNDKRFKYYYKKNGGLSSARNYGLKKAKGDYICFIDSDDFIERDYLNLLYQSIIENNSDISVCYFNRVYESFTNINKIGDGFFELVKYPAAWNKLYKAKLFKENNILFPEGKWYEDLGTFPKLLMLSSNISIVKQPLYNYIQNSSSIMHTYDDRVYQIYDIVEDIERFAIDRKIYQENYANIEFIHIYHILIGTIYRSSFMSDFSKDTLIKIAEYVQSKYPNWYKNKYIKTLPISFKIFLCLLENKNYYIIYLLLKKFNSKFNL